MSLLRSLKGSPVRLCVHQQCRCGGLACKAPLQSLSLVGGCAGAAAGGPGAVRSSFCLHTPCLSIRSFWGGCQWRTPRLGPRLSPSVLFPGLFLSPVYTDCAGVLPARLKAGVASWAHQLWHQKPHSGVPKGDRWGRPVRPSDVVSLACWLACVPCSGEAPFVWCCKCGGSTSVVCLQDFCFCMRTAVGFPSAAGRKGSCASSRFCTCFKNC